MVIAVLGLGASLKEFDPSKFDLSIGVNDIYRSIKTDVVVCLNHSRSFGSDRLRYINDCTPKAFFSQIVNWDYRADFRKIDFIPLYPNNFCQLETKEYHKSFCSPFVAVQIAYKEYGAKEIHLFGVDMINHPNLDKAVCEYIKIHFKNLALALRDRGCAFIVHGKGILKEI